MKAYSFQKSVLLFILPLAPQGKFSNTPSEKVGNKIENLHEKMMFTDSHSSTKYFHLQI